MPSGFASPSPLNFGFVPVGNTADATITVTCMGDPDGDNIQWVSNVSIAGPPLFTPSPNFSIISDDGHAEVGNPGFIVIRFTSTALGAFSGVLTLFDELGNMINAPITVQLNGSGGAGPFLTLAPETTNDFGSVQDGTTSPPLNVLASNNSGVDIIVSAIAFNGDFSAGPGQPAVPFTLLANGASTPVAISVVFTPTLTGFHTNPIAVVVTSDALNSPTAQEMQGTGIIITPAFVVPFSPQAVLMAFVLGGTITVLRMNELDLDTEEPGSFRRIYDWGAPFMEKYLGRVMLRYEDESSVPFDFVVTSTAPRLPSPVVSSVINQGGANDGLIHNVFADFQISDDLVQVQISRAADDGPIVITEIFHEVDRRGEVVENA